MRSALKREAVQRMLMNSLGAQVTSSELRASLMEPPVRLDPKRSPRPKPEQPKPKPRAKARKRPRRSRKRSVSSYEAIGRNIVAALATGGTVELRLARALSALADIVDAGPVVRVHQSLTIAELKEHSEDDLANDIVLPMAVELCAAMTTERRREAARLSHAKIRAVTTPRESLAATTARA